MTCYVRWDHAYYHPPGPIERYVAAHCIVDAEQTAKTSIEQEKPTTKLVRVDKIERIDVVSIAPYQYERKDSDQ